MFLILYCSGGQAKTLMFVHIGPEPDVLAETISTLKFAERVSTVELGAARVNKESGEVKELKEQVLLSSSFFPFILVSFIFTSSLGCFLICL